MIYRNPPSIFGGIQSPSPFFGFGRRPSGLPQFEWGGPRVHASKMAPYPLVYLSSNEEGVTHGPLVYPSSDGEGHVKTPTEKLGFHVFPRGVSCFPFLDIVKRLPHAAFDTRSKWPATSKRCLMQRQRCYGRSPVLICLGTKPYGSPQFE